jgi:hypothetical protein
MREHILLDKAFTYDVKEQKLTPDNGIYSREEGFWRIKDTNEVMMFSDSKDKPASKKCDVETGEDQKGE